jgi:glyoxylase-like metal-dependent hydrolase (beta-lactamase superfamily II)
MWTTTLLQLGYPGKTTHHGGLGWSTIGLARAPGRVAILDTGGFPARRNILSGLAAQNLTPADVTDLLLTHLHHDHCINWPMFPRATIHVEQGELAWALSLPPGHLTVPEAVHALAASPHLKLFAAGDTILPGIKSFPTPGHTPHHVAFALEGAPPTIFAADCAKNRVELTTGETDMTMNAEQSAASIARLKAEWAARPGCVLLPGHDVPMTLASDGTPQPQAHLAAAIDAWFGTTLAEKTRFNLTP